MNAVAPPVNMLKFPFTRYRAKLCLMYCWHVIQISECMKKESHCMTMSEWVKVVCIVKHLKWPMRLKKEPLTVSLLHRVAGFDVQFDLYMYCAVNRCCTCAVVCVTAAVFLYNSGVTA